MTASKTLVRGMALYLALCLLLVAPLQTVSSARAGELGVKTVVLGAVVGAGALFALKAMLGSATAVGSLGAAGTGAAGAVGGALGGLMTGVSSLASTLATGATTLFSSLGAMLSSGVSTVASVVTQPWFFIPAAVIGGGLLVYHFYKKSHQGAGDAANNRTLLQPMGFFDRMRASASNWFYRTPAGGWGNLPPVRPGPYSGAFYNGVGNFYYGGQAAFATGQVAALGGFGAVADTETQAAPATVLGDTQVQGASPVADLRTNLQPGAPAELQADLGLAESARRTAYERLIEALHSPAAPGGVEGEAAQQAIRDYKDAHKRVQDLRDRLGH